ncbi:MAG: hypothetical protein AAF687_11495 [Pseudomonadota bacterium]
MPHTFSAVIPSDEAHRDAQGRTLVAFDPDIVGTNPMVFVQPYWHGSSNPVGAVPVVNEIINANGTHQVVIDDRNAGPDYFLNILMVKRYSADIHGLRMTTSMTPKSLAGGLNVPGLLIDSKAPPQVNILAGYGRAIPDARYASEAVKAIQPGLYSADILTVSGNGDRNRGYQVQNLSALAGSIPHAAQAGFADKTSPGTWTFTFEELWDHPPIVFVTPMAPDAQAGVNSIETVTKVDGRMFECTSATHGPNVKIQWLAVTSNPNYHRHHVNSGIDRFLADFPQFSSHVQQHRAALEAEIIEGTPAPGGATRLRGVEGMDDPYLTAYTGSKIALDVASLFLDGLGFVLSCIGARSAYVAAKQAKAAEAIANILDGNADELSSLTKTVEQLSAEMDAAKSAAAKAKAVAKLMIGLLTLPTAGGLIKVVLTKIYAAMTSWQFIVVCVRLGTQVAAMIAGAVASAGTAVALEVIAWIGRIVALIMGATQLVIDVYNLVKDIVVYVKEHPG